MYCPSRATTAFTNVARLHLRETRLRGLILSPGFHRSGEVEVRPKPTLFLWASLYCLYDNVQVREVKQSYLIRDGFLISILGTVSSCHFHFLEWRRPRRADSA